MKHPLVLLLVLVACACADPPPTFDQTRASLRAAQAVLCWPPDLAALINNSLATDADTSVEAVGLFFAHFQSHLASQRPLCTAYGLTIHLVARAWHMEDNVIVPSVPDFTQYCRGVLPDAGNAPVPNDSDLMRCMVRGAAAANFGYALP